ADSDSRVRQQAIALCGGADPVRTVQKALTAPSNDLAAWTEAITKNDPAFREYLRVALAKNDALLFAVAAQRAEASLAEALRQRLDRLAPAEQTLFVRAALAQRSPALARALFERRKSLPPVLAAHLTLVLENTFGARLGNSLSDWEQWLGEAG